MKRQTTLSVLLVCLVAFSNVKRCSGQPSLPRDRIPADISAKVRQQIENLYASDPKERSEAAGRIRGKEAEPAIPFLIAMFHDNIPLYTSGELQRRAMISSTLYVFSFPNTPGETAANALSGIDRGRPAVQPLLKAMNSKHWTVRANSIRALGNIFSPWIWREEEVQRRTGALQPLLKAIEDSHPKVREYAACVLGMVSDSRAVSPLLTTLLKQDEETKVRANAANALGQIGDQAAVKPLVELAQADGLNSEIRKAVLRSLGRLNDPAAIPVLITALKDPLPGIRMAAVSISRIENSRVVKPLLDALNDPHRVMREVTAGCLGSINDKRVVEALIKALKEDSYPNVRINAARSLGEIKDPKAIEPLIASLTDGNSSVRGAAALALGELKDSRAMKPLIAMVLKEDRWEIPRLRGLQALTKLGHAGAKKALKEYGFHRGNWDEWWIQNKDDLFKSSPANPAPANSGQPGPAPTPNQVNENPSDQANSPANSPTVILAEQNGQTRMPL
jgi:HEAT repeat protein